MNKKLKVVEKIDFISKKEVSFKRDYKDWCVFLNREHNGKAIWELKDDGVYVDASYVEAYGLRFAD